MPSLTQVEEYTADSCGVDSSSLSGGHGEDNHSLASLSRGASMRRLDFFLPVKQKRRVSLAFLSNNKQALFCFGRNNFNNFRLA